VGGLLLIGVLALPVLIAITCHEAAHGFAAHALGDDSAEREGRLTLNPLAHIDPWGTLLLPAVLLLTLGIAFGYAKQMPFDESKLRNPKRDQALIAAAGPLTNILLVLLLALLFVATRSISEAYPLWQSVLHSSIVVNFILIILNLIPLPPLDASKLFIAFSPGVFSKPYELVEPYGYLIIVLVFLVLPLSAPIVGVSMDTAGYFLIRPAYNLADMVLHLFGGA
jgi:Zn-dependent protease